MAAAYFKEIMSGGSSEAEAVDREFSSEGSLMRQLVPAMYRRLRLYLCLFGWSVPFLVALIRALLSSLASALSGMLGIGRATSASGVRPRQ